MEITTDFDAFARALKPADVIVYDSLSSISGLVQWADNTPANHVSIMLDEHKTVMANSRENLPDVYAPDIRELVLGSMEHPSTVRAALILRHNDVKDDDRARDHVVERTSQYLSVGAQFGMLDLVAMAPAALVRSYNKIGFNMSERGNKRVLRGLKLIRDHLVGEVDDDPTTVFCSELVFRCLVESPAELDVKIDFPLQNFPNSLSLEGAPPGWDADLVEAELTFWDWLRGRRHAKEPLKGMLDEDRNGVQPDVVTPGDLWGSPSFDPVIQFQNPPRRRPDPGPDARRYVGEQA